MKSIHILHAFFFVLPCANGAPTAQPSNPPLRGSEDLLGYSSSNTITEQSTEVKYTLVTGQKDDANNGVYLDFEGVDNPQPIRGDLGGSDPGPRNTYYDQINSDKLAPPGTDHGQTINAQWPMGSRLGHDGAGWARQENTNVMPDATAMAGVDMRLEPGAYRELHWHVAAEWSLVLNGSCRIQAVNENGETFIDDVSEGDVWFFPPGVPHSIQALDTGVEFLLVFDDGSFSEDNTFLASEVFAHNPKEVLAKDLGVPITAFENLPEDELYIFPGTPAPKDIEAQNVSTAAGVVPRTQSYSYHFSEQPAHEVAGGSVKIVDPVTFPIASNFSAAVVTVKPGGMREIHWHPSSDEWTFFIRGQGRATLFSAPSTATTFDYRAGDVGYFPQSNSHYIENTGDEDLLFLEVLQADKFTGQWVASTPRQIVADTLKLSNETLSKLKTDKQYVVAG
ncbi:putative oxalate decarboxylase [Aspergillus novofumigatus IBT 16806]|uniref:Putative oxalate decarboxylase n=1 Tax=Aspergillus novofumigatus (strain IBT 16806) TaxID=1392255 RepID=A0A2I1CNU3_ASPN1|nr:putative oxalate decarboxylase [Aspergillus novofumigatus IBT 16806]PKX99282.1 putative oxalate decarboxylase [Aspergillus novofumigatus IBT 16806]